MRNAVIDGFKNIGIVELKSIWFIICAVLAANIGLSIFKFPLHRLVEEDNTLAGIIFGTINILYSLILAFVMMAEWDDFSNLNNTIVSEGDKLNSIMAHSSNLPNTIKATIGSSLAHYCQQVIDQEWIMQERKAVDRSSAIPALRRMLLTTTSTDSLQEKVFKVIDDDLSAISDLRRNRLSLTHSQLPSLVWSILEAGAVMLVMFCYFFHVSSIKMQRLYLSFFVCLLAMCLSIIYNLDHPLSPGSGLDNTAYKKVLSELPSYYRLAHK